VIAIIAILAAILFPVFARAREAARKATCLSNLKQIALAALMYAQDYDEALPLATSTGYAVSHPIVAGQGWPADFTIADAEAANLGSKDYWQLADVVRPYVKSIDLFVCPSLSRRGDWYKVETRALTSGPAIGMLKVGNFDGHLDPTIGKDMWEWTGSYWWGCVHYPYGPGVNVQDYVFDLGRVWLAAQVVGYVTDDTDPAEHWACANAVGLFDNPVWKPIAGCTSFGVHEGYSVPYSDNHAAPPELGGEIPTVPVAMPVAFADGHVKYMRIGFYEMIALATSPNQIQ
jgi:prepilin-type processing-associated H-X9-DG protein